MLTEIKKSKLWNFNSAGFQGNYITKYELQK